MVSVLQRIFANKAKRCFNPPRIIKDADQIMRRTIRKLTAVKDWSLRVGVLRWKYFKLMSKAKAKQKSILKALSMISNPKKDPFSAWQEKTSLGKHMKRSKGVSKIVESLNNLFRSRYKQLIFKSLISKKRLTIFKAIWKQYNKKYYENVRIAMIR